METTARENARPETWRDYLRDSVEELEAMQHNGASLSSRVHKTRVATKRFRSFWRLLKFGGERNVSALALQDLKFCAKVLAPFRDGHVLYETLQKIKSQENEGAGENEAVTASPFPESPARDLALVGLENALIELKHSFGEILETLCESGNRKELVKGLLGIYRKARNDFRRCEKKGKDENWHRLRRWVKDLQYSLEALGQPLRGGLSELHSAMKAMGSELGEAHDLAVLSARLEKDGETLLRENARERAIAHYEEAKQLGGMWLSRRKKEMKRLFQELFFEAKPIPDSQE